MAEEESGSEGVGARAPERPGTSGYDVVVVGSGFGGAMAAHPLVEAGRRVLILERGDWVPRREERAPWTTPWRERSDFSVRTPYVVSGDDRKTVGDFYCVGGRSVVYGGVSLRLREGDFRGGPGPGDEIAWPFDYAALEPHYDLAERLLGVHGDTRADPTRPPRSRELPRGTMELSDTSAELWEAALRLGLTPFRVPLALNQSVEGRPFCTQCGVCDGFACDIEAKNDIATALLPALMARGLELRTNAAVVDLAVSGNRVEAVECVDPRDGSRFTVECEELVVAAGALATPHLLLTAGLDRLSPAGDTVGRYLMRHCNEIVLGAGTGRLGATDDFRKELGIHDFYYGGKSIGGPDGKLGSIQQLRATLVGLAELPLPAALKELLRPVAARFVALMAMAEDQPRRENRVHLDPRETDDLGRPAARIHHRYSERDRAARRALVGKAKEILTEAGAAFTFSVPIRTFSHALGTVRMGDDPALFPVDPEGRLRGVANVRVTDGSVFPTTGAVNPSLTIAANALRVGALMAGADEIGAPGERGEPGRSREGDVGGPAAPGRGAVGSREDRSVRMDR